jgi:hypothetical protein
LGSAQVTVSGRPPSLQETNNTKLSANAMRMCAARFSC